MKINEKNLIAFASCNSPVDKEGFMLKKGEVNKAFQKRWFVLKGNLLFYFEKRGDRDPIGVIILEGCTVELAENMDCYGFELVFTGSSSRTYILATESQEEMESWMKAITCAGYEYMKVMVTELQRQLDEITTSKYVRTVPAIPPSSAQGNKRQTNKTDSGSSSGSSQTTPSGRFNPFDAMVTDQVDAFGAVPFVPMSESSQGNRSSTMNNPYRMHPRSFEEMHEEFGYYIKEREQQAESLRVAAVATDA